MRLLLSEMRTDRGENSDLIETLFYGAEKTLYLFKGTEDGSCPSCNKFNREVEEEFLMLKLPLPDSATEIPLSSLIKSYSETEENVEKKCENCCTHAANCPQSGVCKNHPVARQTKLTRIGKFLIIQLKRYSPRKKKQTKIITEQLLEINNQKYTLACVVEHTGRSINAGHYTCIIRDQNRWMNCDDNKSKEEDPSKIFRGNGDSYLLIYKKIVPTDGSEQTNEFVETEEFVQGDDEFIHTDDSAPTPKAASTDQWQNILKYWENTEITTNTISSGNDSVSNDSEEELPMSQNDIHPSREDVEVSTPPDLSANQTAPDTVIEENHETL